MKKTVVLTPPKNFLIKNIITEGNLDNIFKNNDVEVDECIAEEIKKLWEQGIHTLGCCCGHQTAVGFIQVERTDFAKMIELGYKWYTYPEEFGGKERMDAFIPKSKCHCEVYKIEKELNMLKENATSTKLINVTFIRSNGEEITLATVNTLKQATTVMQEFLDTREYKPPYWRVNFYPEYLEYDVGSWSEFFRIYDYGEFRINKTKEEM